jgi:hypothetical protein
MRRRLGSYSRLSLAAYAARWHRRQSGVSAAISQQGVSLESDVLAAHITVGQTRPNAIHQEGNNALEGMLSESIARLRASIVPGEGKGQSDSAIARFCRYFARRTKAQVPAALMFR